MTTPTTLTRAQLLAPHRTPPEPIELEGWGTVHLRTMRGYEREEVEQNFVGRQGPGGQVATIVGFRGFLLARCLCDEKGGVIFESLEEAEKAIANFDAPHQELLFERAMALNGFSDKDVKDIAGN